MSPRMKLLLFCTLTAIMTCGSADRSVGTPAPGGQDLTGKMFTLSRYGGGLVLYSPSLHPSLMGSTTTTASRTTTRATTRPPYRTTTRATYRTTTRPPYRTTTRATYRTTTRPWTTASPTRGVSVCLRYATDLRSVSVFTLSPSRSPLSLSIGGPSSYTLSFNGYSSVFLQTDVFWSNVRQNIWTSICLTVDTWSGVTQMFRDSTMSIRKVMPYRYSWSGQPVIDFSGFEGQVSDVQVWDYPLSFKEVFYFMTHYSPRQGSALSWSYIKFSVSGKTLLEDSYEQQMKQPTGRKARGRRLKWDQRPRKERSRGTSRWF